MRWVHRWSGVWVLAAAGAVGMRGGQARAAELPSEPGYYSAVPLPGHATAADDPVRGSESFELYLPKNYKADKDLRHPVLLVLGSGSERNKKWIAEQRLTDWADSINPGAIVIGVNRLFNAGTGVGFGVKRGQQPLPGPEGMNEYWALAEKLPQAHSTMRFLVSWASGGSGDSQRVTSLALANPNRIAGYVLGPHPYAYGAIGARDTSFKLMRDISVAVPDVTREAYARGRPETPYCMDPYDIFDPQLWEKQYIVNLRAVGNPYLRVESIDWRLHPETTRQALEFLVTAGWQTKAGVTLSERTHARKELMAALVAAGDQKNAIEGERQFRALLTVPGVADWTEAKPYLQLWYDSLGEAADARTEPLFKCAFLEAALQLPLIKKSPAQTKLTEKLTKLKNSEAYIREAAAESAVRKAAKSVGDEQLLGQDVAGLSKSLAAFEQIAKITNGTLADQERQAWIELLKKRRDEANARKGQ